MLCVSKRKEKEEKQKPHFFIIINVLDGATKLPLKQLRVTQHVQQSSYKQSGRKRRLEDL